jgi:hypothetical protein
LIVGLSETLVQARYARDRRRLRAASSAHAAGRLHEIGRMVGGWVKGAVPPR